MYVNVIQYFKEDYSTGEIVDKIWLGQDWKRDKGFFALRKEMVEKETKKLYTLMLMDDPGYYHKVVDAGDGNPIVYTLKLNKKKVQ